MANFFDSNFNTLPTLAAVNQQITPNDAKIYKFPEHIGSSISSGTQSIEISSIPFIVFSPFLRSRVDTPTYTGNPATVLTQLPMPEFAIVLPLPSSALNTEYAIGYSDLKLAQGGQLISGLKTLVDAAQRGEGVEAAKALGIGAAAALAQGALSNFVKKFNVSPEDVSRGALGIQTNPYTEYAFENVPFRSHAFDFTFIPRKKTESEQLDKIIQVFKFYMHPRYALTPAVTGQQAVVTPYLEFPYEWQILTSVQDTTYRYLPSVLESFNVDYGAGLDSPKFFYDSLENSSTRKRWPSKVTLKMKFREIVMLTRERISTEAPVASTTEENQFPAGSRYRF